MSFQLEVNPTQKNPSRKATLTPRISIQINDEVDQLQCSDVPMPMRRDSRSVHSSISSLNSSSGWDHGVTLMAGVTETSFLLSRTGKLLIDRTVSNDTTISDDENSSGHYKSPQLEERKAFIPKKSMKKVAFSPISPV